MLRVTGTRALSGVPFGAIAPVLRETKDASTIAAALEGAVEALRTRAILRPTLLLVDDAQFLDECTAALVLHAAQLNACPMLVTLRTPYDAPDPVTTLWKDDYARRIDLAPLRTEEIQRLVADALGGPVAVATTRWLSESSGGNPLYLRELLLGAHHSGALSQLDGIWLIRHPFPASARLVDLIGYRLAELSGQAAEVVDLLALGEPLPFDLLFSAVGRQGVEEAELLGAVMRRPGAPEWAMLAHPLFAEVRRQGLSVARHRTLSAILRDTYPRSEQPSGDELVRLATWALGAGGPVDASLMSGAAVYARRMYDWDLAIELATAAMNGGAGIEAAVNLGELLYLNKRPNQAIDVLEAAAAVARTSSEVATVAATRAHVIGTLIGDRVAAEAILDDALRRVDAEADHLLLLDARNTFPFFAAEPTNTLPDALTLMASGDATLAQRAAGVVSASYAQLGRCAEADAIGIRGLALRREAGLPHGRDALQSMGRLMAHRAAGRFAEAESIARAAMDPANQQIGDVIATYEHLLGLVLIDQGRAQAADGPLRNALVFYREHADIGPVRWCLGGLALSHALTGELDQAKAMLAELDAFGPSSMTQFDLDGGDRGRAWIAAQADDTEHARQLFVAAAEVAASKDNHLAELYLRHDLARLGYFADAAPRLCELAEVMEGDLVATFAAHAHALSARDATTLERVCLRFEQMGALLLAAESANAVAALRHDSAADPREVAAWRQKSRVLRQRCGPIVTPGLLQDDAVPRLTKREEQVATLAATGLSSPDIAGRLVLSVRTVENHLQNAYGKLGARNRADLASALGVGSVESE